MREDWIILSILIFIAIVSGWFLGRRSAKKRQAEQNSHGIMHSDYIKGLNYVLNEQPDKAIEIFVKMLEVDSDTVETHLALGNLFRHRGEVDRAIRIHQNLIARPTLDREQRCMALLELGMDYMRSGLLDRAEGLFQELVSIGSHTRNAHKQLMDIYQQEKDWDRAIEEAQSLQAVSGENLSLEVSQFYCEQAEEDIRHDKEDSAAQKIRKALRMDPNCVRASMLEAQLAQSHENYKQAIKSLLRVEKQDPAFICEIVEPIGKAYFALDKKTEFMSFLRQVVKNHDSITAVMMLVNLTAEEEGDEAAFKIIMDESHQRPSIRGVDRLIECVMRASDDETKASLITIKNLTTQLLENKSLYKCQHCGFDAKLLHWHCPSCKKWTVIKPVQGIAGK